MSFPLLLLLECTDCHGYNKAIYNCYGKKKWIALKTAFVTFLSKA